MKKSKRIRLKEIDLSKAKEHECPGINPNGKTQYLIKHDRYFYAGTFTREWFGLSFDGFPSVCGSLQFDAPGSNSSEWRAIWEIIES